MKFKPKSKDELYSVIREIVTNQEKIPNYQYGLKDVDTSLIYDMDELFSCFEDNINFEINIKIDWNDPLNNIVNWDVSNVTNMKFMFYFNKTFNQNINSWNVSNVKNMSYMFNSSKFNKPIDNWNVSNVTNILSMFFNTPFNQPIDSWNISNITNMNSLFDSSSFNQDLSKWCLKLNNKCFLLCFNNKSLHEKKFGTIDGYDDFVKIHLTKDFIKDTLQNGNDIDRYKLLKIIKNNQHIIKDLNIDRELL